MMMQGMPWFTASTSSSRKFARLCQGLQENRPNMEEPDFYFDDFSFPFDDARAQRIGQALRGNTVVTRLRVPVEAMTTAGTTEIAQFIVESPKVNEIYLTCRHDRSRSVAVIDRFLEAAAINGKIRKLEVPQLFGAHSLANCLRGNRKTLVCLRLELSLVGIQQDAIITQQMLDEAQAVAAAIGSLPLLENLELCEKNAPHLVVPILTHLVDHPNLRNLYLNHMDNRTAAQHVSSSFARAALAVRNILQSSTPLQVFSYFTNIDGVQNHVGFNVMFEGLSGHSTLQNLSVRTSAPDGERVLAPLAAELLRCNASLEKLSIDCCNLLGFSTIIEALGTNSTLESLLVHISKIDDDFEEGSRRLATLLPRVQSLKNLELYGFDPSDDKPLGDFLLGFERNTSLVHIYIGARSHAQADVLAYYAARNRAAPRVANATKKDISMILADVLTKDHGLSVVFGALRGRVELIGGSME